MSGSEHSNERIHYNLALMHRYFDLLFSKDLDSMLALIDDDITWHVVPTGDVIHGKVQFAALAQNHWGASPDREKHLLNLFASEEYACMEYTSGGTLTGRVEFPSIQIAPSGGTYLLQVCFVFHFANGKIDRVHEYFDMETVKRITAPTG
ncbi:MAG: nuclear transport factor 2 family protein [Chloroflexi bacterium]|nr:nuclear transport factor 2 family protein [Chloroflexota bacterium]